MKVYIEGKLLHDCFLREQQATAGSFTFVSRQKGLELSYFFFGGEYEKNFMNFNIQENDIEYVIEHKKKNIKLSLFVRDVLFREYNSKDGIWRFFFEENAPKEFYLRKELILTAASYIMAASPASLPFPIERMK